MQSHEILIISASMKRVTEDEVKILLLGKSSIKRREYWKGILVCIFTVGVQKGFFHQENKVPFKVWKMMSRKPRVRSARVKISRLGLSSMKWFIWVFRGWLKWQQSSRKIT